MPEGFDRRVGAGFLGLLDTKIHVRGRRHRDEAFETKSARRCDTAKALSSEAEKRVAARKQFGGGAIERDRFEITLPRRRITQRRKAIRDARPAWAHENSVGLTFLSIGSEVIRLVPA